MLTDFSDVLARLEEGLARHYQDSPLIFNVPGQSVALKIDPFYYLALRPAFVNLLAKWGGVFPSKVEETLLRTGNLVLGPGRARLDEPLLLYDEVRGRTLTLRADFILAGWIDRALALHGGDVEPLPVAPLRLHGSQRERLAAFFAGKTPIADLAFVRPGK